MRNEKLIQARDERGWTQEVAAEKIGVSRVAYARWEEQGVLPRPWAINQAREAFKMTSEQLGFRKYASQTITTRSLIATSSVHVPGVTHVGAKVDMFSLVLSALAVVRQMYGCTLDELLLVTEQEMRRLDTLAQEHPGENRSRRETLKFLIALPAALMGLSQRETMVSLPSEEVLPSYVTAIPACWQLYFDGGIAEVEQALPDYLSQLSTLAQQPSRYQKIAASSASQAYQLFWLLALQHQDFGTALTAIKQAFHYGDMAEDNHLRLASLVRQAHVFFHLKRPLQQVQLHEKAIQFSSDVSPLLQGWLYVVLAESQAHLGQEKEAKQSLSLARDLFPEHPEEDPHFSYVPVDHFFFANHEVLTQLHLNQPNQAWERLTRIDKDLPTTFVPRRVELQNRQADASLKLGDMEQTCTYVELAGTSALKLGSDLRYSEACETYQQTQLKWPHERRVKALAELFQQF
jgi:tetratricopeptide (TPR) repeat protein